MHGHERNRPSPGDAIAAGDPDGDVQRVREQQARIVLDHMYQFVALLDPDGNLLDANQTALDGAGIRREDITGAPFEHARWWQVSPEAQAGVRDSIERAASGEFVRYDVDIFGAAAGDELITIDFSLLPVRLGPGSSVRYLIAEGRNITEQKLAEAEVARQNAQLQELYERVRALDEVKTEFFANVSHELRTPLSLILGPIERLLTEPDSATAPYRRDLEVAQRNARTVLKHVNDLLDISKLEAGRMTASYSRCDVASLIRRCAGHFDGLAADRGLDLQLDLPVELPAETDVEKLERVLLNLIANAVKFTPDSGRIAVHLRTRGPGAEHPLAVVTVEDSGPGVPPSQREVIFERFRQAEGGTRRRFGGTGLGLAIARDFVQLLGGDLRVGDSALGGAAFVLELPLTAPVGAEVGDPAAEQPPSDALSELSSAASGARAAVAQMRAEGAVPAGLVRRRGRPLVLVVEDNADLNAFIADVLGEHYDVTTAGNGVEGLAAALRLRPDLILSDVMMPEMDGAELLAEVRRRPELDGTPFLLLTAKADEQMRVRLLRDGAQDHLTKPFSSAELLARLDLHLRTARREGGPSALLVLAPDGRLLRGRAALASVLAPGSAPPGREAGDAEPDLLAALDPASAAPLRATLEAMRAGSAEPARLVVRPRADGEPGRRLLLVAVPVHDADGGLRHVTASLVDITEEQRAAVAPLHDALAAAEVGVWAEDVDGVVEWSSEQRQILGVTADAAASRDLLRSLTVAEDRPLVDAEVRRCREAQGSVATEFRVVRPDGAERVLLSVGRALRQPDGEPGLVRGVLSDVTDQRRAERAREVLAERDRLAGVRAGELQRATAALSGALTADDVVTVLRQRVTALLDVRLCAVLLAGPGSGEVRAVGHSAASLREEWLALGLPEEDLERAAGGEAAHLDEDGATSWMSLPLRGGRDLRGSWLLAWHAPRRLSAEDTTALRTLADLSAQALERAELYEQQRDVAKALQRGLLPGSLPDVPGVLVAATYQPSGRGADVGGDWYDVIPLPSGRVGLVIGDVEGHSTAAAAVMGQVRNALRAYALEGHPPAGVLERVNRLLDSLSIDELVTCCYVELSPDDSAATIVLAGHPPPLLVAGPGQAALLDVEPSLILGVDSTALFAETTVLLPPGATLVLYTDGLTDLATYRGGDGAGAVLSAARAASAGSVGGREEPPGAVSALAGDAAGPAALVEALLASRTDGCAPDDIAVLAVTLVPASPETASGDERRVSRLLPLDPTSAGAARRFVADVLPQWELDELTDPVALLVSELVTNAVLHTTGDVEVAMSHLSDRLRVEVCDESERLPARRSADDEDTGGRGLLILEVLAQDWGIDLRGAGKAVWFEMALADQAVGAGG